MNKKKGILIWCVFCMLLMGSMSVSAKTIKSNVGYARGSNLYNSVEIYYGDAENISDLKSSNTKVADFVVKNQDGMTDVQLKLKKTGTTQLSYKIKQKNRIDTYKTKVTVYKYSNPFTKLKVGDTDYKSKFKKLTKKNYYDDTVFYQKAKVGSGKLNIGLKSGWKISKIRYSHCSDLGNWKTIKNKSNIKMDPCSEIIISVKNKKNGYVMKFDLWSPR